MGNGCGVASVPNVGSPKIMEEKSVEAGAKSAGAPESDPFAISEFYKTPVAEPSPFWALLSQPAFVNDKYQGPRKQAYHSKAKSVKCVDLLNSLRDKFEGTMMIPEAHGKEVVNALTQACNAEGAKWFDPQFPPHDLCLNRHLTSSSQLGHNNKAVWRRFSEMREQPVMTVDGTGYNDVCQGAMGNCYMIAGICAASGYSNYIERNIYPPAMSDAAVYAVRLCKGHGEWVWVLVDDFLPSSLMSGALYFCNSKERNEFWPSLVEKAMAKLAGSFQCLEGGMVSMGFTGFSGTSHALGGGTEFSVRPELGSPALNAEAMWKVIETAGAEGWAMETSPYGIFDLKDRMGLVAAHAYTVLDGALVGEHRLVRCRNTWGAREWKGAWSDKSKKWDEYPEYAHLRDEKEDGIFFIPLFSENKKDFLRLHKSFSLVIPEHDEQEGNTFVAELREAYGDKWGTDSRDRNFTPHFDSPWIDQKFSFSQWMEESCRFFLGGNPFGGELELSIPQMTRNDPPTKHNCSCLHNNWQLGIEVKGTEPVTFAVSSPFKICFSPTSKTEDGSAARRRFVYDDNIEDDAAWPRYSTSSDVTLKPGTWLVHVSATKAELSKFLGDAGAVVKLKPGAPLTILGEAPAASGYVEAVTQYEAGTENAQPSQWRLTVSEETEATFSADIEQLGGGDEDGWDMFEYWMWIRFNVSEKKEYNWEEYDWEPGWIGEGFGEEANLLKESEGGMYHFEAGVFISHMDYFQGSWLGKLPKGTHVMGLVGTDVCPGKCRITAVVTSTEGKNDCITCEKL